MERGTWWATVHRVTKSQKRLKRLSTHAFKITSKPECIYLELPLIVNKYSQSLPQVLGFRILKWRCRPSYP